MSSVEATATRLSSKREADRHPRRRHLAGMDVVDRIAEPLVHLLARIGGEELVIFVDRLGDDREAQLLGLPRVAVDVESEALLGRVGQPFVDGDAIALGLGDLLAILVEEHLVVEALGRPGAEDAGDLRALGDRVDQILARHLVIDAERDPAHRPVDLPLQLGAAGEDRLLDPLALVLERDQARPRRRPPRSAPAAPCRSPG